VSWSGTPQPKCQKKYNQRLGYSTRASGIQSQRHRLQHSDVRAQRGPTDCSAAPTCTYAEEMTNLANWYAYYHVRIQMAKTAVGLAFNTLTSSYRVGFVTINAYALGSLDSSLFVPIGDFTTTQKSTFYTSFYALQPLRYAAAGGALAVGQYFAGLTSKTRSTTDDR